MDAYELNKVAGTVLFTGLCLVGLNIVSEAMFAAAPPEKPGFQIDIKNTAAAAPAGKPAEDESIDKLLASASIDRGQAVAKQCAVCHTFEKGGPNGIGPNLYGIVGRPKGSEPGFTYSPAMKAKGGDWTIDDLNKFLTNPRDYINGTLMTFAGLSRGGQRADVIDYLNSLADNPKPLPIAKQ